VSKSISFENAASIYEATRGGLERGARYAATIGPQLPPGATFLEIGVGTGAIATPVRDLGHDVFGIDLAPAMLATAHERLGSRIAVADAERLPFPDATFDAVLACWVLHLVGDQQAVLAECARVLTADGRVLVVPADAWEEEENDVAPIIRQLRVDLGRGKDRAPVISPLLEAVGFTLSEDISMDPFVFDQSPEHEAQGIERREWSSCWSLTDDEFATKVQPHIDALRALPEPDRPRRRAHTNHLLVYQRV